MLTHWLCGDGRGGDKKGTIGLCTHCFSLSDVKLLKYKLKDDLNIASFIQKVWRKHKADRQKYYLLIGRQSEVFKVKELTWPLLPDCCKYKLQHTKIPNKKKRQKIY